MPSSAMQEAGSSAKTRNPRIALHKRSDLSWHLNGRMSDDPDFEYLIVDSTIKSLAALVAA